MDPSAFPTVATVIGFTPDSDSGPLVATLACPITSEEVETPVTVQDPPAAKLEETIQIETDDPVTKALVDNIAGRLPTKKPVEKSRCDICNIEVIGKNLDLHLAGVKHFKKMKLLESLAKIQEQTDSEPAPTNPLLCFKCEVCNVSANSIQQLQLHTQGIKHKNNFENLSKKNGNRLKQEPLGCLPALPGSAVAEHSSPMSYVNSAHQPQQRQSSKEHLEINSANITSSERNQSQSYPKASYGLKNNPASRKFVGKMNKNVSSNQYNRFKPFSREKLFQQKITETDSTFGDADANFSCSVCKVKVNSAVQLKQHEASKNHAEKVASYEHASPSVPVKRINNSNDTQSKDGFESLKCDICNIFTNSMIQLQGHLASPKHAEVVARIARPNYPDAQIENSKEAKGGMKRFKCDVCNIYTNSMLQLQQHQSSSKEHLQRISSNKPSNIENKKSQFHTRRSINQPYNPKAPRKYVGNMNKVSPYNRNFNSPHQLKQHQSSREHLEVRSTNMLTRSESDRFECYPRPSYNQQNIPEASRNYDEKMNNNVSYSNQDNRFVPSEEKLFHRRTTSTDITGSSAGVAVANISCSVSKVMFNSAFQLHQNEAAPKHVEQVSSYARPNYPVERVNKPNGTHNKGGVTPFKCDTCNIYTNSMIQLQQHYISLKHLNQVEGKPAFNNRPTSGIPPQTRLTQSANRAFTSDYAAASVHKPLAPVSRHQPILSRMMGNLQSKSL
ncbi:zinc finger protein 385B isoform X2 [Nilaparvata lugens]|uniref:zinc finger protein 385B isoform X2 n=1 Tax=Nilaparvata lugens TaxID=108931 RepID=UPI00193D782E|nr:zinc finger protein 385B isoform X2 [Nilaparvata lugens]